MSVEFGKQNISGPRSTGGSGFTPGKFKEPPVVICQLVRSRQHVWNSGPLYIFPFNITKDSFQFIVRDDYRPGDQCHWIAIGN